MVILKVHFGWSQNVAIALVDRPGIGPQVLMSELDLQNRIGVDRSIYLSRAELNTFLSRFDEAAMGYRIVDFGYDGREISFERRFHNGVLSYEGNASFSKQDAALARVVDQLIAKHGGYTFLRPDASGEGWTLTKLGIPAPRP